MEKQYIIPEELLKAIIGYMAGRPYSEVAPGIAALQQLQEHVPLKTEPKPEEPPAS
jgi:hypothetical protein